jgi:hypothetical protein
MPANVRTAEIAAQAGETDPVPVSLVD